MRYPERDLWVGVAAVACLSLAVLLCADHLENQSRLVAFQQRQLLELGECAGSFQDFIKDVTQDLTFLSQTPDIRHLDAAAARERLASYLQQYRDRGWVRFTLSDDRGHPLVQVGEPPGAVLGAGEEEFGRTGVAWASRPENAKLVDVTVVRDGGAGLRLKLRTPVYETSPSVQVRGVLEAAVEIEPAVRRNLSRLARTAASKSLLVIENRVVASEPSNLAGHLLDEFIPPTTTKTWPSSTQDRPEAGFIDWKHERGVERSGVAWWPMQLGEHRWLVLAVAPGREIALPAGRRLAYALAWLLLTAGLAGAALMLLKLQSHQYLLLREIAGEQERTKEVAELAWQNALLAQTVDEVRFTMDPAVIGRVAVERAAIALGAWRCPIYLPDGDGAYRLAAEFAAPGVSPLPASGSLLPLWAPGTDFSSSLSEEDLAEHADVAVRRLALEMGVRSCLLAPVPLGRDKHGVLALYQDRPRAWKVMEVRLVERIAAQVGTAIKQTALYTEQVRAAEVRSALLKVGPALSSARDRSSVMALAATEAAHLMGSRRTLILIRDAEGEPLRLRASVGLAPEVVGEIAAARFTPAEHPYLEEAVSTREAVVIPRATRDQRVPPADVRSLGLESMVLVMPLLYGESLLGVFVFEREDAGGEVGQVEMEVARAIAELTSAALMNAQLFEALSASEARFEDLYDNAPDMYQTLDRQGVILDCNRTQSRLLGFEKSEMWGRPLEALLAADSLRAWGGILERIFLDGFVQDVSLQLRRKDGKVLDISLNASVMQAARGGSEAARVVLRDVTRLKELEHQFHQSQKLEVIGRLAGGLAHDFNNILSGILGYASLLQSEFQRSPSARRCLETIVRSATFGSELTAKLLAASRRGPRRSEPVDLNRLIEETLEILEPTLQKKIRVETRLDPRLRPLLGDRTHLQQVVLNLCVNARDAMPSGGRLGIETELRANEGRVRLSVEDSGVGMDQAVLDRIFEPFFSTKGAAGTGLGLSVVYGIVKASEGDIKVTSAPGKGTRLDVFLPALWAEDRACVVERKDAIEGQGQLVLLVDDETTLRDLGREILERSGYRVEVAAGGEQAIEIFRSRDGEVSLVILDLIMPGMDGADTCVRLRALDPDLPVLFSSGFSQEGTIEKLLRQGPGGFLPKPYTMADLTQAVAHALGRESEARSR